MVSSGLRRVFQDGRGALLCWQQLSMQLVLAWRPMFWKKDMCFRFRLRCFAMLGRPCKGRPLRGRVGIHARYLTTRYSCIGAFRLCMWSSWSEGFTCTSLGVAIWQIITWRLLATLAGCVARIVQLLTRMVGLRRLRTHGPRGSAATLRSLPDLMALAGLRKWCLAGPLSFSRMWGLRRPSSCLM